MVSVTFSEGFMIQDKIKHLWIMLFVNQKSLSLWDSRAGSPLRMAN